MKYILAFLLMITPAMAAHFYPKVGEEVGVNAFCYTINDAKAIVLSNFPTTIPEDIDCWATPTPLFGKSLGKVDEINEYDILEIGEVHQTFPIGPTQSMLIPFGEATDRFFIIVKRHDEDA